jgi:hypothetical protein
LKEDVEAENRRRLRGQVERVDRQAHACAVAEVDQPGGLFPPQLGAWAGDLAADPIKHQIGTFSIRQLLHLLGQRLFRQGNDVIRAELLRQIVGRQSGRRGTRPDKRRPRR